MLPGAQGNEATSALVHFAGHPLRPWPTTSRLPRAALGAACCWARSCAKYLFCVTFAIMLNDRQATPIGGYLNPVCEKPCGEGTLASFTCS
jgi:hypothetical protein